MHPAQIFIAAILVSAIAPTAAHAQVGAIVVYGTAKAHERQVVAAAVTRTVARASWTVEHSAFTSKEAEDIVTCLALDRPWPCVAPIAGAKHVERVMVVQVDPDGKSVVVIGQLLLKSAAVPSIERRFCDPCTNVALDQSAQELTRVLLERTVARTSTTSIEIQTIPSGASITIDGKSNGTGDRTIAVSPGPHQVQIQLLGYRPHSEQVVVAEGQTFKLTTMLIASDTGTSDSDGKPSRLVPILVGGAGAVALIGGSVYSLTRDPPDSVEQPRYLYSGPGLAMAAAGGIAVGVGLYLWFRHPKNASRPVASFVNHAGVIGWSTSF
jgi:hypothetical protein